MNPKVTVIIPTYCRSDELRRALLSVVSQDYENIEIIVVDDNKPDSVDRADTERIMAELISRCDIKYIKHQMNRNGAAARNTGIKVAKGKYISFLDDDDEYRPGRIRALVDKLETMDESYGMCHSSFKSYYSDTEYIIGKEKIQGQAFERALMRNLFLGSGSNLFVKSGVVKEMGGFDEAFKRNQDLEFLTRLLEKYKIAYVHEDLMIVHGENRKSRTSFEDLKATDELYKEKFKDQIESLSDKDRYKCQSFFKLSELKYSLYRRQYLNVIRLLFKLNPVLVIRYACYLINRHIKKEAYGFKI